MIRSGAAAQPILHALRAQLPVDIVVQPVSTFKTFGDVFTAFTGTVLGIQNGDPITVTYDSLGAPAAAAVGPYPITAVVNAPAAVLANYNVEVGAGTLTVTLSNQVITVNYNAPGIASNGESFTVDATVWTTGQE